PKDTRIGHIHLQVSDIVEAEKFYVDILGFEITIRYENSALFLSAGGYHHHIGLNTWAGTDIGPPTDNSTGLRYFTIRLPDKVEEDQLFERLS
ncbi:MAG: VOC family protein, partial [Nitrososphaerales archaeon]